MMALPKLNFAVVDVRDVATAHIKAMTTQEASGKTNVGVGYNSKNVCKDQELKQSEPKSSPKNQNGK